MSIKVAINGFGRIGRIFLRAAWNSPEIEIVAVNDITDTRTLAHLLKYDSTFGAFAEEVGHGEGFIQVAGRKIRATAIKNPAELPWKEMGIDLVVESTGLFTKRPEAEKHLQAGAKKVLISAPATDPDITIVLGVNEKEYDGKKHHIVSNASCTTNCLAPVVKVLHDSFGLEYGLMTTCHSYTMDQRLLDGSHSDLRRARAACLSMIPTSTGAARAVTEVLPALAGRLDGLSVRVPTPNVSLVDLVVTVTRAAERDAVNQAFVAAAAGDLAGILAVSFEPLVSTDYNGSVFSAVVDAELTSVMGGNLVKVMAWYDNEMGFSNRMLDLAAYVGRTVG